MNENCPILKNIDTGAVIDIYESPFTIGRSLLSNYVIENKIVSRTHFTLNKTPSGWTLTDSSTNGTFINSNHYHSKTSPVLKNNDEISLGIGNYSYKFLQASESVQDVSSIDSKTSNNIQDISDELLNNLADNILQDIESTTRPLPSCAPPSVIQPNTVCQSVSNQSKVQPRDTNTVHINQIAGPSNIVSVIDTKNPNKKLKLVLVTLKKCNNSIYFQNQNIVNPEGKINENESSAQSSNIVTPSESCDIVDSMMVPLPDNEVVINSAIEPTEGQKNEPDSHNPSSPQAGFSKATEKTVPSTAANNQKFEEMEDELTCTICTSLFIKAVTLGCSHSFCQYCIDMWKKKKMECPICRKKITSSNRTLVLDNVIEKMLENAPEDMKEYRKTALEERQKLEEPKKNVQKKGPVARRGGRQNSNSRGPGPVIVIQDSQSSESSNSDMSEYDDSEWEDGVPGAYYGGYGRCFNCGARGHWTTGCPFR
ncbi:E3 ubiquitin-protein ligase RNF8-like isoform X2 [Sitophilus oryzae]|uniref:E3 ubiquitin-protein ligase CHFR n=1 Tax=Sitophilus oryzae TaxID=7048 RepID=A0A6J2XUV3_SITOR|nr:E3 ubiquitin-protein ligase RNF8-like isoform X2 [Sitophilus oryzae]